MLRKTGTGRRMALGSSMNALRRRMAADEMRGALSRGGGRVRVRNLPGAQCALAAAATAHAALARQVAIYLSHTRLGFNYTAAGRLFGRDRTTAAHACRTVEDKREDPGLDAILDCLERAIGVWPLRAASGRRTMKHDRPGEGHGSQSSPPVRPRRQARSR